MKYDIKLISLDVDNTLVDDQKEIPEENLKAIRWAHFEKGVHIAVNSGRIAPSVKDYMDRLGIKEAFPALGGCTVQEYDGTIIHENTIDKAVALGIREEALRLGCTTFYYHHNDWVLDPGNDFWAESEYRATKLHGTFADLGKTIAEKAPNKLLGVNNNGGIISRLMEIISEKYKDRIDCFKSTDSFLEILPKGVNKGTAVDVLCDYYHIQKENVMSIGDFYNDVDMFVHSGLSVAMANAPDDVKAMANYVTVNDNNHCGVAEAIRKFIQGC